MDVSELGDRLRQARSDKGLSIDDVQSLTKIQKRYLTGIEEGNYDAMPGPFYIRAFVRQYADAVGLNGDELLAEFKHELPAATKTAAPQMAATSVGRRGYRSGNKLMEIFPMILVALFVIAILAIAYVLSQRAPVESPVEDNGETEITIETQAPEEEPVVVEEETEEEVEEPQEPVQTVVVTPTSTSGEDAFFDVTDAETLTVRIDFTGDSWLSIQNQSGTELLPKADVYTAEDASYTFDVPAAGTYRVRIGVTSAAKVFVNDQEVPFQTGRNTENLYFNWIQ